MNARGHRQPEALQTGLLRQPLPLQEQVLPKFYGVLQFQESFKFILLCP